MSWVLHASALEIRKLGCWKLFSDRVTQLESVKADICGFGGRTLSSYPVMLIKLWRARGNAACENMTSTDKRSLGLAQANMGVLIKYQGL